MQGTADGWEKPADLSGGTERAKRATVYEFTVVQAAQLIDSFMRKTRAKLGGQYVTSNVSKNDELCIKNAELCIQNEEFCI